MVKIGIDCAPGAVRPDTYIQGALDLFETGLQAYETDNRLFGAWTWEFNDITANEYSLIKPKLKVYFDDLYGRGKIRGAEWKFLLPGDICPTCGAEKMQLSTDDEKFCIYCTLSGKYKQATNEEDK